MAVVDFSQVSLTFDTRQQLVALNKDLAFHADASYSWFTSSAFVSLSGVNFTFDQAGKPTGGSLHGFNVNLEANGPSGLFVSGLDGNLADLNALATLSVEQQNNLIWRTVLAGSDTIALGSRASAEGFNIYLAGDGRDLETGQSVHAAADKIRGDIGGGGISGDFYAVLQAGSLYGGDDTLSIRGSGSAEVYGDATSVGGFVHGGDDRIAAGIGVGFVLADAGVVVVGGSLVGGADTVTLRQSGSVYGDANQTGGYVDGGDDKIIGSDGNDFLCGDVQIVLATGDFVGGNDIVHGGKRSDTIYGDWQTVDSGAEAAGGNDRLYGDAGKDTISGGGGKDRIDGGTSADRLRGGSGADTFVFARHYGKDTIGDFDASGKGHDVIDLTGLKGVDTFSDVKAMMTDFGKDVLIDAGHGDVLIVQHVEIRDLVKGDFLL